MTMSHPKKYFKTIQERDEDPALMELAAREFQDELDLETTPLSRRGFLTAAGFSFGALATLSGCERAPVTKAVPFLVQPEEITPGRSVHYATTCGGCSAACGMLAKSRDGRPIKLEGNPEHPLTRGGLCAVGQASILELYDSKRITEPKQGGSATTWEAADSAINERLATMKSSNDSGSVRVLSRSVTSPTTQRAIDAFLAQFDDGSHVVYEPHSCSAILDSHVATHGRRVLPHYQFDQAHVIAAFDADFLGTWISPVEFTNARQRGRELRESHDAFSYHIQFESRMTVTGSNADQRVVIAPRDLDSTMRTLAHLIAQRAGTHADFAAPNTTNVPAVTMAELADRLWANRGHSLVVCGSNTVNTQVVCNYINHLLQNYGHTLDITIPSLQRTDDDAALATLCQEIEAGAVSALILHGVNPVYDLPNGVALAEQFASIPLVINCGRRADETTVATFRCPDHHYLESWGDHEPVLGSISLRQPIVAPIGNTRAFAESLAVWSGKPQSMLRQLRETYPNQKFWDTTLHDGVGSVALANVDGAVFNAAALSSLSKAEPLVKAGSMQLALYTKVGMPDSAFAANAWLQELPDPVTKMTWDNYACLSPASAERMEVENGDVISINVDGAGAIELPVFVQLGQHDDVVAVAMNYGAKESSRFAEVGPQWFEARETLGDNGLVGTNAATLITLQSDQHLQYAGADATLQKVGRHHVLAASQEYQMITVPDHLAPSEETKRRPMIQETTFVALTTGATDHASHGAHHGPNEGLWKDSDHPYDGHHWGMVVDISACTGCSGCVIACQVENNVPVVGKDEIRRNREMSWMRIDRYYAETEDGGIDVAHQPLMCHHCDNAPCETVCPVLATVHSEEGLNQQVYNRCVGTRYCANNCPYKVRRFNWFNYTHNDAMENLVLNPDVAVRSRGVMEKCSFCVQRIQEAKIEAKRQGRPLADGDAVPACQQSCPANAIVFGDMNDPGSEVSKLIASGRHYRLLDEINVKPSVGYLSLVRNRATTTADPHSTTDHEGQHG